MKLTEKEKQIIRDLNRHPYTVEYCEEWLNRKPENVQINAPAALCQMAVECFVQTVKHIAKFGPPKRRNKDYILLDSITVGKTEFVLGKLDNEKVDMWVTWAKNSENDFDWGHYFSNESKAKKDLLDRAAEALIPQIHNGAEKEKETSDESAHKEGICPVCGGIITYGSFELVDEGGMYFWDCGSCGASGREGYDLVFDGSHYGVTLGDAVTKLDDIPAGHIAVMTVDSKTIQTLTPMLQCQSLDYGANRICKNELLFSKTVDIGYGYSAELRVTASDDGDPLNVNVWLLHDDKLDYDYDGEDAILGTWVLANENNDKFLLVVKEGEEV